MATCLITGCGGFVGSHLAELMLGNGWKVYGTVHRDTRNVAKCLANVTLVEADVNDGERVRSLLSDASPDVVFHLASQAYIGPSWQSPEGTLVTNVLGTLHLLDAVRGLRVRPVVVVSGSSAEYGTAGANKGPISENSPLHPQTPYALSKVGMTMLACMYARHYQLPVVGIRPFALIGPRKTRDAVSDFARGIVRIERREAKEVVVGNLDAVRDFVDVRDGVTAMALVAQRGRSEEVYNICSGVGRRLREVLNDLIAISGVRIDVRVTTERMRRSDDAVLVGNGEKLARLGWKPEIPLRRTLVEILQFWRAEASREAWNPSR